MRRGTGPEHRDSCCWRPLVVRPVDWGSVKEGGCCGRGLVEGRGREEEVSGEREV